MTELDPQARWMALPGAQANHHRFRVGEIEALAVADGGSPIGWQPGADMPPEPALRLLACLLLRMPGSGALVLVDAGWGPDPVRFGKKLPTAGRLLRSLADAGVAPGDVDVVLISHIHPDHIGGLFDRDGARIFPNATYHASAEEVAFWAQVEVDLSGSPAPAPLKAQMIGDSRRMLAFSGDTLKTFQAGEEAIPGIATMDLPGHTPGQVGFVISNGGATLVYAADTMTTPEMSIDTPGWENPYDYDPKQAVRTRLRLLEMLSSTGWHSFTPHFPWPNLGRVRAEGERFVWQPAADTSSR